MDSHKKIACLGLTCLFATSVAVAFAANEVTGVGAAITECTHVGNHYEAKNPTAAEAGTKEFWACCSCHEHYLEKPAGTWADAGIAPTVDSSDDRYWTLEEYSKSPELAEDLKELGFGSVTNYKNKANNGYTVGNYSGEPTLILPDGVRQISTTAFKNYGKNKLQWIVIPSNCAVSEGVFSTQQTCKIYFVGNKDTGSWSKYDLEVYKIQGTGWDYVDGVPTAK